MLSPIRYRLSVRNIFRKKKKFTRSSAVITDTGGKVVVVVAVVADVAVAKQCIIEIISPITFN